MAAKVSLRDRRRADTVAEIKAIALSQLETGGADALSLRAVARDLGVSVQALYHYFDSRDALITALVTDAFSAIADAVLAIDDGPSGRIVGAGLAYRRWARENQAAFLLALGTPVPGYAAPELGPTTQAAARMGAAFQEILFGEWTPSQLQAVPLAGASSLSSRGDAELDPKGLPPGALALFMTGWACLHGFVMLEMHGHLTWLGDAGEQTCRSIMTTYAETVERARRGL